MAEYLPHGGNFVFAGFSANFLTRDVGAYGHTYHAADITPISQAVDTPKKFKGGSRYMLNDIPMLAFYDPKNADPPHATTTGTGTITLVAGTATAGTRAGTGLILDWNDGGHVEDSEDAMILSYTWKWEGGTKPTFTASTDV